MKPGIVDIESARAYLLKCLDEGWRPFSAGISKSLEGPCARQQLWTTDELETFRRTGAYPRMGWTFRRWAQRLVEANDGAGDWAPEICRLGDPKERVRRFLEGGK